MHQAKLHGTAECKLFAPVSETHVMFPNLMAVTTPTPYLASEITPKTA